MRKYLQHACILIACVAMLGFTSPYMGSDAEPELVIVRRTARHGDEDYHYVAGIPKQQALSIVRTQLEAEGLRLGSEPPQASVDFWGGELVLRPTLFDANANVALLLLGWEPPGSSTLQSLINWTQMPEMVAEAFAQQGIVAGVIYNWGSSIEMCGSEQQHWNELSTLDNAMYGLNQQAQQFIELLQTEGIL